MLSTVAAVALSTLLTGFIAGRRYERAVRGWSDYRARRAEVPILRVAARLLSVRAAGAVLLAAGVAAFSLYVMATEGR